MVHHKNRIKSDNSINNLEVLLNSTHAKEHSYLLKEKEELIKRIQELEQQLDLVGKS